MQARLSKVLRADFLAPALQPLTIDAGDLVVVKRLIDASLSGQARALFMVSQFLMP